MSSAESNTVYVGGVSYDARENDVQEFFSQCGEVVSVRLPTFPDSGRAKGIAFVEFADKAAVDAALNLTDSEFLGRSIKVDVARGKTERSDRGGYNDRRGGQRDRSSERYGSRRDNGRDNRGGYERRSNRSPARQPSEPSDSVFVGNLAFAASERDLADHFAGCGSIVSVRIPTDRNSGRQKGFGYVTFESREAADKAMGLSGTDIAGRSIRVDYAASRNN